jgi:DNA-directed RNA polymerase subunit RPC12/RpoP
LWTIRFKCRNCKHEFVHKVTTENQNKPAACPKCNSLLVDLNPPT